MGEFCLMLYKRTQDADVENDLKETFRVFSKDDEGCITAEELKFVLTHLPGKVTYKEIDEMIHTVDKNGDGKINYSEFRVMIGAKPNLTSAMAQKKKAAAAAAAAAAKASSAGNTGTTGTTTIGGIPIGGSSATATSVGNCLTTSANSTMPK